MMFPRQYNIHLIWNPFGIQKLYKVFDIRLLDQNFEPKSLGIARGDHGFPTRFPSSDREGVGRGRGETRDPCDIEKVYNPKEYFLTIPFTVCFTFHWSLLSKGVEDCHVPGKGPD